MAESRIVPGLILSIFPGLDLLGMAFAAQGYCVVRGPDVVMGQDIRGWHSPSGVFEGVIGGPPCQFYSKTKNLIAGEPRFGDLIPEFCRVVEEAQSRWWLMENVTQAPEPVIPGYQAEHVILSPRDLGDPQSRRRRFSVGYYAGLQWPLPRIQARLDRVALENIDLEPCVTRGKRSYRTMKAKAVIQGYPELAELRNDGMWTVDGINSFIAQGVPRVMGEAIARAIKDWQEGKPVPGEARTGKQKE